MTPVDDTAMRAREAASDLSFTLGNRIDLTDDCRTAINQAFLAFAQQSPQPEGAVPEGDEGVVRRARQIAADLAIARRDAHRANGDRFTDTDEDCRERYISGFWDDQPSVQAAVAALVATCADQPIEPREASTPSGAVEALREALEVIPERIRRYVAMTRESPYWEDRTTNCLETGIYQPVLAIARTAIASLDKGGERG